MSRSNLMFVLTFGLATVGVAQVPAVVGKHMVAGLDSTVGQFIMPLRDETLFVGINDVAMISDDQHIKWHVTGVSSKKYEINDYCRAGNDAFVVGGWSGVGKKNNLWLLKILQSGAKVWERFIPLKNDGQVLALTEDPAGKGFWAVVNEKISKKQTLQTLRFFDETGAETMKYPVGVSGDLFATTSFDKDVTLMAVPGKGFYIFGATSHNTFEGYFYHLPATGEVQLTADQYVIIERSVIDKTYSDFVVLNNPAGGFYAAYASMSENNRGEDYRLVSLDADMQVVWGKDFGGSEADGFSSMVMDRKGNLIMAGFSYSDVSGDKTEPAFEKEHCDVWVVKVSPDGNKLWDKTITGPGCILNARLFLEDDKIGVTYKEESRVVIALLEEQ